MNFSLADFGMDAVPLFIPYNLHKGLFNEKYTNAPAGYAYTIPVSADFSTAVYMDTSYDGHYSQINIYPAVEESSVTGLTFGVNSFLNKVDDFYAYDISATFVKSPEGDSYIYVQCGLDDGYARLRVFSFSFNSMFEEKSDDKEDNMNYFVNFGAGEDAKEYPGHVMTDPLDFYIRTVDNNGESRVAYAECCINSMGLPVPKEGTWQYAKMIR